MLLNLVSKMKFCTFCISLSHFLCQYWVESCIISLHLNCIMQLKQFYNVVTKVSTSRKCYYFWWSTWLIIVLMSRIHKRHSGKCLVLIFCSYPSKLIIVGIYNFVNPEMFHGQCVHWQIRYSLIFFSIYVADWILGLLCIYGRVRSKPVRRPYACM